MMGGVGFGDTGQLACNLVTQPRGDWGLNNVDGSGRVEEV